MKKLGKILLGLVLGIFLVIVIGFFFLQWASKPTPEDKRNMSLDGVKMEVEVVDDTRKPIIKTMKLADYKKQTQEEEERIEDNVKGRVEGDIPCADLTLDQNIYFTFTSKGKIINLENLPRIEITSGPYYYEDEEGDKKIEDQLVDLGHGKYSYTLKRYRTQYEKYFLEYNYIEVFYTIEGEDYVSVLSVHGSTPEADFFENETLDKPIPPDNEI